MEVENFMVMPDYNTTIDRIPDDVWAEMEDRAWEDLRDNNFEEGM